MWHWDQGRLGYFQFDVLRKIAQFCLNNDLTKASHAELFTATGLAFDPQDTSYKPWRNYSRVFKSMFLVAQTESGAMPTSIAALLAEPGKVSADEYFHFIVQASTEPSPALQSYNWKTEPRYPLLFATKYLMAKSALGIADGTTFDEIIGAYRNSDFSGDESDEEYISLVQNGVNFDAIGKSSDSTLRRQARESLRVICQISYLYMESGLIFSSLAPDDAKDAFDELAPIGGNRKEAAPAEILRRSEFFSDGSVLDFFDYPKTVMSEIIEAGFSEGGKAPKTHIVTERNNSLRRRYTELFDPRICDICNIDTSQSYPWTDRVIDLHHKLPLTSGTRVEQQSTVFTDLVPVCPSCHRAVHRYYSSWLKSNNKSDFDDPEQASEIYDKVKTKFTGFQYAS